MFSSPFQILTLHNTLIRLCSIYVPYLYLPLSHLSPLPFNFLSLLSSPYHCSDTSFNTKARVLTLDLKVILALPTLLRYLKAFSGCFFSPSFHFGLLDMVSVVLINISKNSQRIEKRKYLLERNRGVSNFIKEAYFLCLKE